MMRSWRSATHALYAFRTIASVFPIKSATSCVLTPRCNRIRAKVCRKRCGVGLMFQGPHSAHSSFSRLRQVSVMMSSVVGLCAPKI